MSATRCTDRQSLCTFTFADGRRCRTPRQSGHPFLCCFHARKEAQAHAAEEIGRDVAHFFSRDYLSACDLNAALGRLFTATLRGHVPPKTSRTLAYLAQVMVQCIQITEHEYAETFGCDEWRHAVSSSVNSNAGCLSPAPPPPASSPARVIPSAAAGTSSLDGSSALRTSSSVSSTAPKTAVTTATNAAPPCDAGFLSPPSNPSPFTPQPNVASSSPAPQPASPPQAASPNQLRSAPSFASSFKSQLKQLLASELAVSGSAQTQSSHPATPLGVSVQAGLTPGSSPADSSTHSISAVIPSAGGERLSPVPAPVGSNLSSSSATADPAAPAPNPPAPSTPAHLLPGFAKPANWDVLIPRGRCPRRRR